MKIAILGTGRVGTALGSSFASAGHDVVFGSRTPGGDKNAVSYRDAADGADVIVTALPGTVVVQTLEEVGDDVLSGAVVLDVSNAFTPEFTLAYPNDSVGRLIQERFPAARVVKSLSTMNTSVMTNPAATPAPTTVFVSGDDDTAKNVVRTLLGDLGWAKDSILDLGGIATAVGPEHYGLLFFGIVTALQNPTFNIAVVR